MDLDKQPACNCPDLIKASGLVQASEGLVLKCGQLKDVFTPLRWDQRHRVSCEGEGLG